MRPKATTCQAKHDTRLADGREVLFPAAMSLAVRCPIAADFHRNSTAPGAFNRWRALVRFLHACSPSLATTEAAPVPSTNDYLLVNEAADLLGVSPNTIRNWGRDGKIAEYRHPVNNYRLFSRSELERIRKKLNSPSRRRPKPR